MNLSVSGIIRTTLVTAAGAGLVVGAMHTPGAFAVASTRAVDTGTSSATSPVRSASLVCPGPELKGLKGVEDLDVSVRVAAAAAPVRAMTGTVPAPAPGELSLSRMPRGSLGAPVTARGVNLLADQKRATQSRL